ncbi:MAG TPA: TIGR03792 family protein [Cyanobacteria bacterium UBA11162]|nr:TIGR03792 family protein [Cyanobacteria bacterium UBA11162]
MVIEWLKIRVKSELREKFIQKDTEIWTSALAKCRGFVGKEVWIDPDTPTDIILIIRWAKREDWSGVSSELLTKTEQEFDQEFDGHYQIIEQAEYQVRKFPQISN